MVIVRDIFLPPPEHWPPRRRPLCDRSILPVNVYRPCTAAGNCVGMIRPVFPDHTAISLNVDELELNVLAGWSRNIQEPVGIIGIEHGANCRGKRRAPVP